MLILQTLTSISFKYKANLLGNTEADGTDGILKTATIAVPLKCLSNFWRSLEMLSITCKAELNLNGQSILLCQQMAMIMIMINIVILFLPSKTQNCMFQLKIYEWKTIKNY